MNRLLIEIWSALISPASEEESSGAYALVTSKISFFRHLFYYFIKYQHGNVSVFWGRSIFLSLYQVKAILFCALGIEIYWLGSSKEINTSSRICENWKLTYLIRNPFILVFYNSSFTGMDLADQVSRLCTFTNSKIVNIFTTSQGFKIHRYVKTFLKVR